MISVTPPVIEHILQKGDRRTTAHPRRRRATPPVARPDRHRRPRPTPSPAGSTPSRSAPTTSTGTSTTPTSAPPSATSAPSTASVDHPDAYVLDRRSALREDPGDGRASAATRSCSRADSTPTLPLEWYEDLLRAIEGEVPAGQHPRLQPPRDLPLHTRSASSALKTVARTAQGGGPQQPARAAAARSSSTASARRMTAARS